MEVRLLFLLLLCYPCHGWWCGYSELSGSGKVCDCSGEEITQDEYRDKKKCCPPPGPGHCEVNAEGNGSEQDLSLLCRCTHE